jgi:hypothetical protein
VSGKEVTTVDTDGNGADAVEMVSVTLLEVPVEVWSRADDEAKDLMREFALIALNRDRSEPDVPTQLMNLIEELQQSYGSLGREQEIRFSRARSEQEEVIDRLDYLLPKGSDHDIRRLGEKLDQADDYCRSGQHLLSLASTPSAKAFRNWFLGEFEAQLNGADPIPWPRSPHAVAAREVVAE